MRLTGELLCQTCREHEATFVASLDGEAWVACIGCREQAHRVKSRARFRRLGAVEAKEVS